MSGIVIVDLDGTLADGSHRMHLLPSIENRSRTECWDAFNLAAGGDEPIQSTIDVVNSLWMNNEVIILSGRCDVAVDITVKWLRDNHVAYDELIMRKQGDHRQDIVIKEEVLRSLGLDNILCAFDDLPHVVDHIRSLGITCYHVGNSDEAYIKRNKGAGNAK